MGLASIISEILGSIKLFPNLTSLVDNRKTVIYQGCNVVQDKASLLLIEQAKGDPDLGVIDVDVLDAKEDAALLSAIEKAQDAGESFYQDVALDAIDDVCLQASLPVIQTPLEFFSGILSPKDLNLLRTCLYLKTRHDRGLPILEMKMSIARRFGERGTNMANLCARNYFEEWFMPRYGSLLEEAAGEEELAKDAFLKEFETAVLELPWSIFVNTRISEDALKDQILVKLFRIKSYGHNFLNVHGLGEENIATIKGARLSIEALGLDIKSTFIETPGSISANFRVPDGGFILPEGMGVPSKD